MILVELVEKRMECPEAPQQPCSSARVEAMADCFRCCRQTCWASWERSAERRRLSFDPPHAALGHLHPFVLWCCSRVV